MIDATPTEPAGLNEPMGPTNPTESVPAPIVRSREQLAISHTLRVRGAVRLHKRIVTETVTQTVEVRREELVITDLAADEISLPTSASSTSAGQLSDREFDFVLHEERIVVSTVTVPIERVHVRVRVVSDNQQIVETVREEHVDLLTEPTVTPSLPRSPD